MGTSKRVSLDIEFADGETRTVKPLTIKNLRKFMAAADKLEKTDTADSSRLTEEDINNMMDAASIILSNVDPELAKDRDALEDAVDIEIFGKLMQVAMGTAVSDPNE